MKTLREKIQKAIDNEINNSGKFRREQYEDNYDGFTHSTYSGLADQVEEELINEGYDENVNMSIIENFVFDLF